MDSIPSSSAATSTTNSLDGRGTGSGSNSDFLNLSMFGQPSGVGDLLLGAGSFGGSIGNGYGNDSGSSNSVPSVGAPTSGSGSTTFDLNDFPSLGGGGVAGGGATPTTNNNGLSAALRQQQQQILAHQQMLQNSSKSSNSSNLYRLAMQSGVNGNQNFNMATEDFPALPGAPVGGNGGGANGETSILLGGNGNTGSLSGTPGSSFVNPVSRTSSGASGNGLYGDLDMGSQLDSNGLQGGAGLSSGISGLQLGSSNQVPSMSQPRSSTPSSTATTGSVTPAPSAAQGPSGSVAGSALAGDFGLLGLLSVIRMTDADRNALALGTDLTMLGINLNTGEKLYTNFASPFSDSPATQEPHYQLPMCYYMQPPTIKTGHMTKFTLETLFYLFYTMPKDIMQACTAQELYSREWRYHAELKRWFKRTSAADGVTNSSSGAPQFLYFDIQTWERRLFTGPLQNIANGFLSEDDVRVKLPNS
mmetsp:Transcript_26911/g.40727  ORF Transcript_26911/g.40727 Transcript_26911/m.40727 type:complete len:474 (-) Transcript_26911:215-1636(-)|eukprot:CAMPEP_0178923680 /NCGR_PEP_ID=MMETSP0786-20121207/16881_1 /TAXON_ID=186022 /ORGANISM="Thalassionema frauenfeldii, Strain CCMP 1798" /LENGTH=473 /DNA_ID=CAMNT_0020598257 /DNA_START=306 /DNA_END=1727 /DNA_ORIENTATION=+